MFKWYMENKDAIAAVQLMKVIQQLVQLLRFKKSYSEQMTILNNLAYYKEWYYKLEAD